MSCAAGTLARTGPRQLTPLEKLFEGADLYGERDEYPALVNEPLQFAMRPCVEIKTADGLELTCEADHDLRLPVRGFVAASESLHCSIRTHEGTTKVVSVKSVGLRRVVMIHAYPDQAYETNGILS